MVKPKNGSFQEGVCLLVDLYYFHNFKKPSDRVSAGMWLYDGLMKTIMAHLCNLLVLIKYFRRAQALWVTKRKNDSR